MKILGIEASGLVASVAVVEDGLLKGEFTVNNRLTHSETLLPMLEQLLQLLKLEPEELDAIAVSAGPGSFTGLRIGAATAKGLALALNKPVVRVSSLAALAFNLIHAGDCVICPLMDARRGQVYCAAYQDGLELIPEQACDIHSFLAQLNELDTCAENHFIFLGDGVPVHQETIADEIADVYTFATAENNRQRAASVAELGRLLYRKWLREQGLTVEEVFSSGADAIHCFNEIVMNSDELTPEYLRKPQAERELEAGQLEDPGLHSLKKMQQEARRRKDRRATPEAGKSPEESI